MSSDSTRPASGARWGSWILLAAAVFQVGYPILLSAEFGPHPKVTLIILAFLFLGAMMNLGFVWARVINVLLSGAIGCYLLVGMLSLLGSFGDRLHDRWSVFLMIPVIPAIGFSACALLLLLPVVTASQNSIRQR